MTSKQSLTSHITIFDYKQKQIISNINYNLNNNNNHNNKFIIPNKDNIINNNNTNNTNNYNNNINNNCLNKETNNNNNHQNNNNNNKIIQKQRENKQKIIINNNNNIIQSPNTNPKQKSLTIQLKCLQNCAQYQDPSIKRINPILFSTQKEIRKLNQNHNHRKLKTHTFYQYQKSDYPQFNHQYKESGFTPLFVSEHELKIKNKIIVMQEKKQKQQELNYQKELNENREKIKHQYQKEKEKKQIQRNKIIDKMKRNQQGIGNANDRKLTKYKNNEYQFYNRLRINCSLQSNTSKKSSTSQLKPQFKPIQTRIQLNQYICQVQRQAIPQPRNNYCFPCRSSYIDYLKHIQQEVHKMNIKQCLGEQFLDQQLQIFTKNKKEQINCKQFKCLKDFADFLQQFVDQLEVMCDMKNEWAKDVLEKEGVIMGGKIGETTKEVI